MPQQLRILPSELGSPPYAITGPDSAELSDRWQDALVMKDMIRKLWDRIVAEKARDAAWLGAHLQA